MALPYSSSAGENHRQSLLNRPEAIARVRSPRAGFAMMMRHKFLTTAICKAYREGVAATGFRDNFDCFRDEQPENEYVEWIIKDRCLKEVSERAKTEGVGENWHPICYTYLVSTLFCYSSANANQRLSGCAVVAQQNELGGEADTFGGVVISDDSMQRFIIFNYYNEANLTKYHALNKRRARELMSLVLYLGLPDPLWFGPLSPP